MESNASQNGTGGPVIACAVYHSAPHLYGPWYTQPVNLALFVIYIIIIVAAIVGNLMVCAAVCVNANLRRASSSYFIVSLAISDIGTAAFSMTFDLESLTMMGCWPLGRGETLCVIWTVAYMITVPTSMLNLFALSIDRYRTLRDPWDRFKESPSMTPRRALAIIVLIWAYCLIFTLVPVLGIQPFGPKTILHERCIFNISPTTSMINSFVNFYLPMSAMCWIYYRIYKIAHTQYKVPTGLEKNSSCMSYKTSSMHLGEKRDDNYDESDREQEENVLRREGNRNVKGEKAGMSGLENVGFELSENVLAGKTQQLRGVSDGGADKSPNTGNTDSSPADASLVISNIASQHPRATNDKSNDYSEAEEKAVKDKQNNPLEKRQEADKSPNKRFGDKITESSCSDGFDSTDPACSAVQIHRYSPVVDCDVGDRDLGVAEVLKLTPVASVPGRSKCVTCASDIPSGTCTPPSAGDTQKKGSNNNENPVEIVSNTIERQDRHLRKARKRGLAGLGSNGISRKTASSPLSAATLGSVHGIRKKRFRVFVKNTKAARTIAVIVGAFLTCWVPFTTFSVVVNFCKSACYDKLPPEIFPGLLVLGYLNSALNPVLFSYQNPNFRRAYRTIIRRLICY